MWFQFVAELYFWRPDNDGGWVMKRKGFSENLLCTYKTYPSSLFLVLKLKATKEEWERGSERKMQFWYLGMCGFFCELSWKQRERERGAYCGGCCCFVSTKKRGRRKTIDLHHHFEFFISCVTSSFYFYFMIEKINNLCLSIYLWI